MGAADDGLRFRGKYRVPSARLAGWNYAVAGWYVVAVCVKPHRARLGDIVAGEVRLSPVGLMVAEEWQRTP